MQIISSFLVILKFTPVFIPSRGLPIYHCRSFGRYNKSGIKYSCLQSYSREKLPNIPAPHIRPSDRFPASTTQYTILDAISHSVTLKKYKIVDLSSNI